MNGARPPPQPPAAAGRAAAVPLAAAVAALALAAAAASAFGAERVSFARAFADPGGIDRVLLLDARLPRVALAAVAGGGLAAVGVAFQALLRNPLAEPYLLGVSGGAALGASVAIASGLLALPLAGAWAVPLCALAGGLAATALVYGVARAGGAVSGTTILLAGVVVNAFAGAVVTFLKALVPAAKAQELLYWLMGFLDVPSPASLGALCAYVFAGAALLFRESGRMNLLALGDEAAAHLGVDVARTERRVFFACSAVVGAIVSLTGLIGFVGLVVPHVLRRLVGADHRLLLPLSFLGGGAALVACDLAARLCFRPLGTEPPVGAVTALVGGPFFLLLLVRRGGARGAF